MEARANDDELAEAVVAAGLDLNDGDARPRLSEWSGEREEIAYIGDLIGVLIDTVRGTTGNKPSGIRPRPRPMTAIEKARRRAGQREHESLAAHLLHAVPDPPA